MDVIRVDNLVKTYRQGAASVRALDGVSLAVAAGDFVAIMGASGSGKSTLLHLLAGLTSPDSGSLVIDGTDLASLSDHQLTLFRRRRIGLIFQSFNLVPTLTARHNVALPLLMDGLDTAAALDRADRTLETLGLGKRAGHRPDALSGGEQQRVAIARALINDPAVILADEPTGNLDSANSQLVCELLRGLSTNAGRTIVMVTHETDVAAYAMRSIVMRDGRILARTELHEAPESVRSAG